MVVPPTATWATEPVDIGSDREPFVDDHNGTRLGEGRNNLHATAAGGAYRHVHAKNARQQGCPRMPSTEINDARTVKVAPATNFTRQQSPKRHRLWMISSSSMLAWEPDLPHYPGQTEYRASCVRTDECDRVQFCERVLTFSLDGRLLPSVRIDQHE